LRAVGRPKWNRRLARALVIIETLTTYDTLLIGGGNAKVIDIDLPPNVRVVSNAAGITGGVRLWDPKVDEVFAREGVDHRPPPATVTPAPADP